MRLGEVALTVRYWSICLDLVTVVNAAVMQNLQVVEGGDTSLIRHCEISHSQDARYQTLPVRIRGCLDIHLHVFIESQH